MSSEKPSKLRIGVLPPNSNFVPFLAKDMLAAIELGLKEARLDADLIIESAGYNADSATFTQSVQRLILSKSVHCVIAPLNVSLIEKTAGYFESQGVPLIALNLTEDPLFESARNPFVFVNSFYLWHSAWMSGYLAGRRFGKRAASIVALHEGGYNLTFAFQLGLEAAGGELVKSSVTHIKSTGDDPTEKIREIASQSPDFIWAAYSGKEAVSFLKAFENSGFKDKIPLMTISPMVSRNIRRNAGSSVDGIWYATPADSQEHETENLLAKTLGREPNPYAALAYESVKLLADAVRNANETKNFTEVFPELLQNVKLQNHRGAVQFNNYFGNEAFYLRQVTGEEDTSEKISAPPNLNEQYPLACRKFVKEGWVNPYLCA
jgi:branched-chain amino acid transport system substrate-binding protein